MCCKPAAVSAWSVVEILGVHTSEACVIGLLFTEDNSSENAIVLLASAQKKWTSKQNKEHQAPDQPEAQSNKEQPAHEDKADQTMKPSALTMVIYSQPQATDTNHFSQAATDSSIGYSSIGYCTSNHPERLITQGTSVSPSSSVSIDFRKMTEAIKVLQSLFGHMCDDQSYVRYDFQQFKKVFHRKLDDPMVTLSQAQNSMESQIVRIWMLIIRICPMKSPLSVLKRLKS
ncbi:hypothetical protein F511_39017 [Dorcoceras hygrometricum]|uniref:Uncharacterized protein n=1 Tax=Dorcoceras hygrometricum TaxID=472368 RepID=A0A2Z7A7S6_9LAMI|nr:hypothetical protein F511_39017 [Dorcoceras hygrometricum]